MRTRNSTASGSTSSSTVPSTRASATSGAIRRRNTAYDSSSAGHLGLAAGGDVGLEPQRLGVGQRGVGAGGHGGDEVGHPVDLGPQAGGASRVRDDGLAQQVVLGPEPPVHAPGRQARLADDVHDLGAVVALPGEHGGRGPQQPLAQLVALGGPWGTVTSVTAPRINVLPLMLEGLVVKATGGLATAP